MSANAAISYDIGTIKPGEEKEFVLLMYLKYDDEDIKDTAEQIDKLRKLNFDKEIEKVNKYWQKYVDAHDTLKLKNDGTEYTNKLIQIYKRTILFMPLLMNEKTGGISASLEIDEEQDKCGKYAYCWPRDAVMCMKH